MLFLDARPVLRSEVREFVNSHTSSMVPLLPLPREHHTNECQWQLVCCNEHVTALPWVAP